MPVRARPQVAWRPHSRSTGAHLITAFGHRSGALRLTVAAALVAGLLLGSAMPTDAVPPPPDNPSDGQIQQSQNDAAASAAEVGRLAGLVAQTEGEIQRLQNDMEMKAELANKARVDLDVAESDAAAAASAAQHARDEVTGADQAVTEAKEKAAAFAAASFRQGSVLGSLSAYWDAGSAGEILQRQELLGQMSGSQLNAMSNLEATRTHKANLDSAARAASDAANAARARADEARVAADQARQDAADALQSGQDQLASLQARHDQQQNDYQAALATVAGLQNQRDQYNQWLAQKQAEEEAARKAAEEAARQAAEAAARQAAEEAARQEAARQAAAAQAAADAAAAQAAAEAEAERQSAAQEAANQAARAAQEAANNSAGPVFATCDDARAAGRGPIPRDDPAYRSELDPNNNGMACDGGSSGSGGQASSEPFYANCDDARAAGVAPINRGSAGYRAALDPNNNGIACEGTVAAAQAVSYSSSTSSSSGNSSSRGQQVVNAAMQWLGTTYAWGGGDYDGPTLGIRDGGVADRYGDYKKVGFDCSGLALYAWAQVGVYLPHYSVYQYTGQSNKISRGNLQPGDLVFFANNTSSPSTIHHVAIWIGNNQIVEAPNSGSYVKISTMYWDGYIGAVRPG
ncbi:excalibur calcium-binding domain-containing protein [Nakamurella sp.]|uniref:excalibur calcium-binding domain-containing protein n=1 Tax=Nakamurella sp. TaxID=1869182 RepID=UPI0037850E00